MQKPDLNLTSMEEGDFLCAVGFLTICQCDTLGPHFLPHRGPAPEILLDCVAPIQSLSRKGAEAQASFTEVLLSPGEGASPRGP